MELAKTDEKMTETIKKPQELTDDQKKLQDLQREYMNECRIVGDLTFKIEAMTEDLEKTKLIMHNLNKDYVKLYNKVNKQDEQKPEVTQ